MSAQHTPGPWLLSEAGTTYALDETQSCNRFSARVDGGWTFRSASSLGASGDRTTQAELQANARLIAAAPELLRELEALVTAVCFADPPKNFNGVECHEARVPLAFIEGARAAIAKATGAA